MINKLYVILVNVFFSTVFLIVSAICIFGPFFHKANNIGDVFVFAFLFFIGVTFITMFINGFVTGRKFDKLFKAKLLADKDVKYELSAPGLSGRMMILLPATRAGLYGLCIVFPRWAYKMYAYRKWFGGYDFRKNASWLEITLCYLKMIFLGLIVVFLCLATIAKLVMFL